jgi:hypothetical protein
MEWDHTFTRQYFSNYIFELLTWSNFLVSVKIIKYDLRTLEMLSQDGWSNQFVTRWLVHPICHKMAGPTNLSQEGWSTQFVTRWLVHTICHKMADPPNLSQDGWSNEVMHLISVGALLARSCPCHGCVYWLHGSLLSAALLPWAMTGASTRLWHLDPNT